MPTPLFHKRFSECLNDIQSHESYTPLCKEEMDLFMFSMPFRENIFQCRSSQNASFEDDCKRIISLFYDKTFGIRNLDPKLHFNTFNHFVHHLRRIGIQPNAEELNCFCDISGAMKNLFSLGRMRMISFKSIHQLVKRVLMQERRKEKLEYLLDRNWCLCGVNDVINIVMNYLPTKIDSINQMLTHFLERGQVLPIF